MNTVDETYNKDPERELCRLMKDPYHSSEFLVCGMRQMCWGKTKPSGGVG